MAKIECPICDMDVSSQEAIGLGDSFKRHLMDVHRMSSLACIDMNEGVEPAKEIATYGVQRHVAVERPVRAGETIREPTMTERLRGKGSKVMEGTEGKVRDVTGMRSSEMGTEGRSGDLPGGSGRVVDVSSPSERLENVRMTAPEFAIKCPFCNSVFRADDDDKLGRDLKDHWGDEHQIRPTIRAELHMSRAR